MGWSGSVCCHTAHASGTVQMGVYPRTPEGLSLGALTQSEHVVMDVIAGTEIACPESQRGKSPIIKRSVSLNGHKTSVSLELPFWVELKSIADERKVALSDLISKVDVERQRGNLSSALRLFVLAQYRPGAVDTLSPAFPAKSPHQQSRP
jgi:predicted DNA-binding ribbon-helix-helix protein